MKWDDRPPRAWWYEPEGRRHPSLDSDPGWLKAIEGFIKALGFALAVWAMAWLLYSCGTSWIWQL